MLTTIVYAHPYDKSFNRAILDTVTASLSARGREYSLIDLCRDGFDPVLTCDELAVYPEGGMPDPLVKRYNRILDQTEKVILIFPIWWYDCPAILKGFLDKVMLNGSAFTSDEKGLHAKRNIPETLVITTSNAATEAIVTKFGDAINQMMIGAVFKFIGFNGGSWQNFGGIGKSSEEERKKFLQKIHSLA